MKNSGWVFVLACFAALTTLGHAATELLSGEVSAQVTPVNAPSATPPAREPATEVPGVSQPSPPPSAPSPAASRTHIHRPGTDVDGDVFSGSLASSAYVLKGNVILHSDPAIDREIGAATESNEPLTVTADEVDADNMAMTFVAKGHVHFVQGERSGHADVAMLDDQHHTLDLIGNADVSEGDRRAAAGKIHYNMLDKQFLGSQNVRIYEPLPTPKPAAAATAAPKRKRRLPF